MHDCQKTKKNLVDLVFGELEAGRQHHALAEVTSCPDCSQEYQSLLATLRVFNQATDAAMPDESYWMGYEARLRAKLAEPVLPARRARFAGWFADQFARMSATPAIPMAAVAGLILVAVISVVWVSRQKTNTRQVIVAKTTPTLESTPMGSAPVKSDQAQNEIQPKPQSFVAVKSSRPRQPRQIVKPAEATPNNLIVTNFSETLITRAPQTDAKLVAAPASHLEKAQLLLRSFRNARADGKNVSLDLAYEKRQAGKLVYDNILLRREAEAKGYLPMEEALNSLEPLLLDIANLPDKPSRGEVQAIRERIQKQEMIATLQIVSSGSERFSPPVLLNP